MNSPESQSLTLAELASSSGASARTIRFYISRGLVDGPRGAGRGAAYDQAHLQQLETIRDMKLAGLSLREIRRKLGESAHGKLPEPEAWWQYQVADDVRIEIRGSVSPWRMRRIQNLLGEICGRLDETGEEDNND